MKTLIVTFLLMTFCLVFACKKAAENTNETILTCYDEMGINPWEHDTNDSALIKNVSDYLKSKSISVIEVAISNDGTRELCKAAYCKTGRRVKATIKMGDLTKINEIKFYECQ